VDLTKFVAFSNEASWTGLQTADHTLVFATFDDKGPGSRAYIFVMQYDPGQETVLRYSAIWDMMTASLAVTPKDTATP
jgi:hypothetical protein